MNKKIDVNDVLKISTKYILQGLAIAIAAYYVPIMYKTSLRKPTFKEIFLIAITAAFTMLLLDYFTEPIGFAAKFGAGFTIGQKLITMI